MNSENQAKLLDTLTSIARSLELMLERLDMIEDRMTDILEALPGDEEEEP
jgi:hypothetical protein